MTTTRAFALHMLDRADTLCATVWSGDIITATREIAALTETETRMLLGALTHRIISALGQPWDGWGVNPEHGLHEGDPELSGWRMIAACGNRDLPMLLALTGFVCSQGLCAVGVCTRFLIDTLGAALEVGR